VAVLDRHAAAAGVAIVDGGLGPTIGTSAVVAEWARSKLVRVALARTASGYRATTTETFVKGIASPVAVLTTADGALLVGDWASGSVYRISGSDTTGG